MSQKQEVAPPRHQVTQELSIVTTHPARSSLEEYPLNTFPGKNRQIFQVCLGCGVTGSRDGASCVHCLFWCRPQKQRVLALLQKGLSSKYQVRLGKSTNAPGPP